MTFLNPTYLWALLGLLIPIAIHLWSKKEGKTIKVGSIELLRESESKQTSSIKPNELWLLLLRLLIISLVVMILAEPQLKLKTENDAITYIIEPSLVKDNKASSILNSIDENHSIKLLTKRFPELESIDLDDLSTDTPNYWQLAKDMETIPSDSIIVYTEALISGFKGKRPNIIKNIDWITISDKENNNPIPIRATRIDSQVEVLSMITQDELTKFSKSLVDENSVDDNLEIIENNPIKILLHSNEDFTTDSKFIEASFSAISKHLNRTIEVDTDENSNTKYDLIVWLDQQSPIPQTNSKLLVYKFDELSHNIIQESDKQNLFYLTTRLNTKNIIDNYLPEQLLNILDLNADLEEAINKNDKRVLSKAELLPIQSFEKALKKTDNYLSISKWLWLLLAFLLLNERIIAHYRKQ